MSLSSPLPSTIALFEAMADAVYLIDPADSRILWGNRASWAMLGLTPQDVLEHSVLSLQKDVTGLPQWSDIAEAIRASAPCFVFVGRHRHADGHEVAVEVNTTVLHEGGREYFLSVARDVSKRLALEAELRTRERQLSFALNEAADGLWDWDIASGELFFSPQLKRMLGYGPDEMAPVLATWRDNIHPEDAPRVVALLQEHLDDRQVRFEAEYRLRNRNGVHLWVHDIGRVCDRDAAGRPVRAVGMVRDVTARKQLEERLRSLASQDPLTGLPNRRHGMAYLEGELARAQRQGHSVGLAMIDVDHFKSVNDVHGHDVGDHVLCRVAAALASAGRVSDMVCRWGGEEFVIIAPDTELTQMATVAEKARLALREAFAADSGLEPVTISVGVAAAQGTATVAKHLIARADLALYEAKQAGRDRVVCADA
jgi:diguanylate cyclase (GGDEF)-like protein/PAS domain S-box-containing protein